MDFKTWQDFADNYDLVMFNNCVNLEGGEVMNEFADAHDCQYDECECEVYQWYAIAVSQGQADYLNKHYGLDIFYSDTLNMFILPVYHWGTGWDCVPMSRREEQSNECQHKDANGNACYNCENSSGVCGDGEGNH